MTLKKKFREFFTLTRKAEGFTLVELIVVIAIMAILAGVAVPAYTGYIKKAETAADEQLLSSLNTAFAAACMMNGEDNRGRSDVSASLTGTEGAMEASVTVSGISDFDETFGMLYEGGTFKKVTSLIYDAAFGGFKNPDTAEEMTIAYGGGFVKVSGEAVRALKDSTFYGEGMDSEKLMNQVDRVASIAGGMGSVANVMATEEYLNASLEALGITPTGTIAEKKALLEAKATDLALKKMGLTSIDQITEANKAEFGTILSDISNNSLVLYTAQSTTKMDTETAKGLLKDADSELIKKAMNNGLTDAEKATGMNQAALAYGMYYAYVNSDACTDATLKKDDIVAMDVITALDSNDEFRTYMDSPQGTKDMEAYLQALNVINSSTQSPEAVEKIVTDGFTDPDLLKILTQSMGK